MSWGRVDARCAGVGPPVVVLHRDLGPVGTDALVASLAGRRRVHTITLPGFGASDLPAWARTIAHLASLTGHVLDAAGLDGAPLVGLGFGGWVAATIAATAPARVGALALVSPMGLKPVEGEIVDQFLFSARGYAASAVGGAERLGEVLVGEAAADPDAFLDRSREAVTRVAWKPIGHDPALGGLLAEVRIPSLVVWGTDDRIVPPATARQWAACLRVDRVVMVDGGAHHVEVSHPDAVGAAVASFLDSIDAGA